MSNPLWTVEEIQAATGAAVSGDGGLAIAGISIDTRSLERGDLFVALTDKRDGHEFVSSAFAKGAAAALVRRDYAAADGDGVLIRVDDPLDGLRAMARSARSRLGAEARVIGVTGSVGKTGTKEMLRVCLARLGKTHAADKSFNNHWGVPLTLARMPREAEFAVIEIGMNHAGEITPLTKLARPHVAIVTTVAPVHLEFFDSVDGIAEAKAEIFSGLVEGGVAVINADNAYHDLLEMRAGEAGAQIVSFGSKDTASVRMITCAGGETGSDLAVEAEGRQYRMHVGAPGAHIAQNALAVLAALLHVTDRVEEALAALASIKPAAGRGARREIIVAGGKVLLIDESYNANPASMQAALNGLGEVPRSAFGRRIAVLGDMLELGEMSEELHRSLREDVRAAGIDKVFAAGEKMKALYEALPQSVQGAWAETSAGLKAPLAAFVEAGDAVMIKGSLGSNMAPLLDVVARKDVREA